MASELGPPLLFLASALTYCSVHMMDLRRVPPHGNVKQPHPASRLEPIPRNP